MKVLHKINLIPTQDFLALQEVKDALLQTVAKSIDIDGNIKDLDDKFVIRNTPNWDDWKFSLGSVFNSSNSIDVFNNVLDHSFNVVLKAIQKILLDEGYKNPIPTITRYYRNNSNIKWHRHDFTDRNKSFVSIYYTHPNWNIDWGGDLEIGWIGKENMYSYPCLSNSVIIHDGHLGHRVTNLSESFTGGRDVFVAHWRVD